MSRSVSDTILRVTFLCAVILLGTLLPTTHAQAAACPLTPITCPADQEPFYTATENEQCDSPGFYCKARNGASPKPPAQAPPTDDTSDITPEAPATAPEPGDSVQRPTPPVAPAIDYLSESEVRRFQEALILRGYLEKGNATGFFGPLTSAAVQAFQCAEGIICSGTEASTGYGRLGPRTRSALLAAAVPPYTPTISTSVTSNVLSIGDRGPAVVAIQNRLIELGFLDSGNNTGYFGPLTRRALRAFQCARGVVCDGDEASTGYGLYGPRTRAALASDEASAPSQSLSSFVVPAESLQIGDRGSDVIALQNILIALDYLAEDLNTGYFGNLTRQALRRFQCDREIVCDGSEEATGFGVLGPRTRSGIRTAVSTLDPPLATNDPGGRSNRPPTRSGGGSGGGTGTGDDTGIDDDPTDDPGDDPPPDDTTSDNCTFNGQSVAHGSSVTAYQAVSVAFGSQCVSETRTCTDGTLSGTYTYASCAMLPTETTGLFSTNASLLPGGVSYTFTVPDTLDLEERASWFIRGGTNARIPSLYSAPAAAIQSDQVPYFKEKCTYDGVNSVPCLFESAPNWGKTMHALAYAREMSNYDRTNSASTVSTQRTMITNMLDPDISLDLQGRGIPGIMLPQSTITPTTAGMEALIAQWKLRPSEALRQQIDEFVRMHRDVAVPLTDSTGRVFTHSYYVGTTSPETFQGYFGDYLIPFIHGKALSALSEWYVLSGNTDALTVANGLSEFIRNYETSVLWRSPDATDSRFVFQSGFFAGHIHSWLKAATGLADHAIALRVNNPSNTLAAVEADLADTVYNFVKRQVQPGRVGHFGESGSTGDMIVLGLKLTEMGYGPYYEEIDAWTRNSLAETQIDAAAVSLMQNNTHSRYEHSQVASKTEGLFFANATHIFDIPHHTLMFSADYPANSFKGMYEVWSRIVEYSGSVARIQFLLNKSSLYLDVLSELPYAGRVTLHTKPTIGPVSTIEIRYPEWANQSSLQIWRLTDGGTRQLVGSGDWSWINGSRYIQLRNVAPNTKYILEFPIEASTETVYERRARSSFWFEGSHETTGSPEVLTPYTVSFRGNTVVDATPRPSGGIPRYQRSALRSLPSVNRDAPTASRSRFVAHGGSAHIPQDIVEQVISDPGTGSCDEGWLYIPAEPGGAVGDFCVMQFEAQNPRPDLFDATYNASSEPLYEVATTYTSQTPVSAYSASVSAPTYPWAYATQRDAVAACARIGGGAHLVTLAESQAVSRNLVAQPQNWDSNVPGQGCLYGGHVDEDPSLYIAAPTSADDHYGFMTETAQTAPDKDLGGCFTRSRYLQAGGEKVSRTNGRLARRSMYLSTGEIIWDWSGNLAEWLPESFTNNGSGPGAPYSWTGESNGSGYFDYNPSDHVTSSEPNRPAQTYTEWTNGYLQDHESLVGGPLASGLSWSSSLSTASGAGMYFGPSTNGASGFRGGAVYHGNEAGIFHLHIDHSPDFNSPFMGFRCAKPPLN